MDYRTSSLGLSPPRCTRDKFENFIKEKSKDIPEAWSNEKLDEKSIEPKIVTWMNQYFNPQQDCITGNLVSDLIKISRHIAKNELPPEYHEFREREFYDLRKLALKLSDKKPKEIWVHAKTEFDKQGSLWKEFYKDFSKFITAINFAIIIIISTTDPVGGGIYEEKHSDPPFDDVVTLEEREQIKKRDNYTCQCCLKSGRGVRLEIDHIIPKKWGGQATVENSQALCKECNSQKNTNAINFKSHTPPSGFTPREPIYFPRVGGEGPKHTLARIIDSFYYCQAVCEIRLSKKKNGKFFSTWEVELYQGNNPEWLEKYKPQLIQYIRDKFGLSYLEDIKLMTAQH